MRKIFNFQFYSFAINFQCLKHWIIGPLLKIVNWKLIIIAVLLAPAITHAATLGKVQSNNIGLVGWWTLDGSQTNWATGKTLDSSGSGNTGQLVSMSTSTSPENGKIGQALHFNGSNYVNIGDHYGFLSSESFSISVWFKIDNLSSNVLILDRQNISGGYHIRYLGNGIELRARYVGSQIFINTLVAITQAETWYQYVIVFDRRTNVASTYVNGVFNTSADISSVGDLNAPELFEIGSDNGTGLGGEVDDVRVYNRPLSATEVKALYNSGSAKVATSNFGSTTAPLASGLVGYWTLDGSKTNWTTGKTLDSSNLGNTGTMQNMSTSTTPVAGKVGQSFSFDGINDSITLGNPSGLHLAANGSFTISAWVFPTSTNIRKCILCKSNGSNHAGFEYGFWLESNARYTLAIDDGTTEVDMNGTSVYTTNSWQHYVVQFDAVNNKAYFFKNGVADGTANYTGGPPNSNSVAAAIGALGGAVNFYFFGGYMDDLRVYNRALSPSEVLQLYNLNLPKIASSGGVGSSTIPVGSGLLGYWTLDGSKTNWATGKTLDSSGNGNTGTLILLSTTTAPVAGKVGQAMQFDGSSYVSTTVTNYFTSVDKSNSFFAWVYPTRSSINITSITQIGETADGNFATGLGISNGILVRNEDGDQSPMPSSGLSVPLNQWSFVGYVHYQASNLTDFYVNDTTVTVSDTENRPISPNPVLIGAGAHNSVLGSFFSGKIDDVRLYGRSLTPAEVQKLYLMGR